MRNDGDKMEENARRLVLRFHRHIRRVCKSQHFFGQFCFPGIRHTGVAGNVESAYEPSAPSSSVPESQSKPPESGRPSVAWSSIDDILAGMSLRGKICQMLVLSPELLTGVSGVTAAGETTRQALVDMPVGGLIYSRPNLKSRQQVCKMLSNTQSYSKIPLILTCDEEGGRVNRLMSTVGTTYIGPMFGYRDQGGGNREAERPHHCFGYAGAGI